MNTHPLLLAALLIVAALAAVLWVWRTVQRVETELHVEAELDTTDFDVGTWAPSSRAAFRSVRTG